MSISGVSSATISSLQALSPTSFSSDSQASKRVSAGDSGANRMTLTPKSHFLAKLRTLTETDPAKAKQFATELAGKMHARAKEDGGTKGKRAEELADKLDKAIASGDYSSLFQKGGDSKSAAASSPTSAYAATTKASW